MTYDHRKIEKKWQDRWIKEKIFEISDEKKGKENEYILVEFPYPSGNLHVGHWYAYSVFDIYARYRRMSGKNVLFPFGFDAFGLPAENAAIKRKINPREWTFSNIEYMKKQMKAMGASLDWSREVITADPYYYKWTQWLFLQFLKNELAYQSNTSVNWCPSCKTVLANEQVVAGHCERCESEVEQKTMRQWQLLITNYAEKLHKDLEKLEWPDPIKEAQRNWIGKSEGAEIEFEIKGRESKIKVFTTRPDTIFGATYLVLSPERAQDLTLELNIENNDEVEKYIKKANKKTELERQENKEKSGVEIKGLKAINPANNEEIPIWVADYVLGGYGTGSIMAVPAHDERDFEFAKKFGLLTRCVIKPYSYPSAEKYFLNWQKHNSSDVGLTDFDEAHGGRINEILQGKIWHSRIGILINSGEFNGIDSDEAIPKIIKFVKGKKKTTYKMRDWIVSRQRYWGCPIPVIHCEKCGALPVPEKDLPVVLPEIEDYLPTGDGKSPLAKVKDWVNVKCPKCGGEAQRETDTLDTFVDSSWYFLRYLDPKNNKEFADKKKLKKWMPINFYSGGAEHTTMHLLYSRFFHKALFDMKFVGEAEPYLKRMNRGLILGPDGNKMSKSKGNVVDPDEYIERLGADTVRTYLAFIGPYNEVGAYPWSPDGIVGVRRFLEKTWRISKERVGKGELSETLVHKTIKNVTEIISKLKMNTAVAALMEFVNIAEKEGLTKKQMETFVKLLLPFAPHLSEEIWETLGNKTLLSEERWPEYDPSKVLEDTVTIAVQVNGKTRGTFEAKSGLSEEEAYNKAVKIKNIADKIVDKKPKRIIYIEDRLINIVV